MNNTDYLYNNSKTAIMIQTEVVNRVFCIICNGSTGSCFTMEQDGVQYIITAKHLFKSLSFPNHAIVQVLLSGKVFQNLEVDIYYHSKDYDVAVLKTVPYQTISPFYSNSCSTEGIIFGQDAFFLGFPYDYGNNLGDLLGLDRPIPFVKKACVSGISGKIMLLDGHNNPGFSGGPVCFKNCAPQTKTMNIAGVISGYRYSKTPVLDNMGNETGFYVKSNTGIIYAYDISVARDIIRDRDK